MKIAALTVTKRPQLLLHVCQMLMAQTRRPDMWIIIGDGFEPDEVAGISDSVFKRICMRADFKEKKTVGQMRNMGMVHGLTQGMTHVAMVDDDDWYGPGYFLDLEESIEAHDWGDVYGIREYNIGFCRPPHVAVDGSNIIDQRNCNGGQVIEGNRVTWVSGATVAIAVASWVKKGLKYRQPSDFTPTPSPTGGIGGEDGGLWEECRAKDGVIIRRPSDNFCAVRIIASDGWGGEHGHTWGPVHHTPPKPPGYAIASKVLEPVGTRDGLEFLIRCLQAGKAAVDGREAGVKPAIQIAVRRNAVATKLPLSTLGSIIVEDPSVGVGQIVIRDETGYVYRTLELGAD